MSTPRVNRPYKKTGRKAKEPTRNLEQIEALAMFGLTDDEIAVVLGVCRKTLFKWRKQDARLEEALQKGKSKADLSVVKSLYERATGGGDTTAAIFWLKNRQPDRWRDRRDFEHTGELKVTGPLQIEIVHTKNDAKPAKAEKPQVK